MTPRPPMRLPWHKHTVPHAVLDILRGCNIHCRDCYNLLAPQLKTLAEIEEQLDQLMKLRSLQSVSIVGGEITLHPDLAEIVRRVRRRGLFVELFSNGATLTAGLLDSLSEAGANVLFLHIEAGQKRPDLSPDPTRGELEELRHRKAQLVVSHGIEAGLSITAYPDAQDEIEEAVRCVLATGDLDYLLVTFWRNVRLMPQIRGNLDEGLQALGTHTAPQRDSAGDFTQEQLYRMMEDRFGLSPFAFLGSNLDRDAARWVSYLSASVHHPKRPPQHVGLKATWLEETFLRGYHLIKRKYPFYQKQHQARHAVHLALNAITGGGARRKLELLLQGMRPRTGLSMKRILFQWPAAMEPDGRILHCDGCPDAVVMQGELVPLCISDRVSQSTGTARNDTPTIQQ